MLVTQGQTSVQFSCKYLQGTEETEPSPNQPCHSPTGHSPRNTWEPDWKTALQNVGRFLKFFASDLKKKTKTSFQLKCFYKTVMTPTQNSTIRARMGNTSLVLCSKRTTVGLFNRVWQQGHTSGKKSQRRDMPGSLAGLCNKSPRVKQFSLTELFRGICSEKPYSTAETHKQAFCTSCCRVEEQQTALPHSVVHPPLTSMFTSKSWQVWWITNPTQILRGQECTLYHSFPGCPDLQEIQVRLILEEPSTCFVPFLLKYTLTPRQWESQVFSLSLSLPCNKETTTR